MRPIVCFGEALIDFLQINELQQPPLTLPEFRQFPGGAPANAAVAIAKLGGIAKFAGQVGGDNFGDFLLQSLEKYQVDLAFAGKNKAVKTALAFVLLDEFGERSFSFHRDKTADVIFSPTQVDDNWFNDNAIFHFCSNTLTDSPVREATEHAVSRAIYFGNTVSFDVNLRHNLWPSNKVDKDIVNNLVRQSNIVKFSREEFDYLCGDNADEYIRQCLKQRCQLLIITDGFAPIRYFTHTHQETVIPEAVTVVDTTAGGDAFIGALLYGLSFTGDLSSSIDDLTSLKRLVRFASICGAIAVTKPGAFPALPTQNDVLDYINQHAIEASLKSFISGEVQ